MLECKNISLSLRLDGRELIKDFSFALNCGEKAALIGEEGNGKSTLLQYIYDPALVEDYCDAAGRVIAKGRLAYLPQVMPKDYEALSLAEFFAGASPAVLPGVFRQLGLPVELAESSRSMKTLSGGERVKVQLALLLSEEPDVLLLDEPTNDLDIETLSWLEGFLQRTKLPVMYVSHDETLIAATANVIIHIEQLIRKTKSRITITRAGYEEYLSRRSHDFDKQAQVAAKQRADYDKQMEKWRQIYQRVDFEQENITRGDPSGGRLLKKKMHAVKAMGRRLEREKEDFLDFPESEDAILTKFDPDIRLPNGKVVLDYRLDALTVGERVLARNIALFVSGSAHIGIVGKNGAGKSTLLARLWDALCGRKDITPALMPQDYSSVLPFDLSPIEFLTGQYVKSQVTKARTCLGSMRFTDEEMTGKIRRLSGGQMAKLLFLDMVLKRADVLILDEPTRNFSPLSGPVVRSALKSFGGAIISVSHDRKYLAEVCDTVYELTEDGLALSARHSEG